MILQGLLIKHLTKITYLYFQSLSEGTYSTSYHQDYKHPAAEVAVLRYSDCNTWASLAVVMLLWTTMQFSASANGTWLWLKAFWTNVTKKRSAINVTNIFCNQCDKKGAYNNVTHWRILRCNVNPAVKVFVTICKPKLLVQFIVVPY